MARKKRRSPKPKVAPQESPDPVKITVSLDPRLLQWAKLQAAQAGATLHELVEVALVNHLKSHAPAEDLDARLLEFVRRQDGRRRG